MSTRSQNGASVLEVAADVMRTRSGRALQDAARAPQKTPSRRARKSVTREPYEETPTDPTGKPDADPSDLEQESRTSAATPAPSESTEPQLGSNQFVEKENRAITDTTVSTVPDKSNRKRTNSQTSDKAVKVARIIPVGKPKSGRVWKDRNKQRFSALLRDKPLRSSWQKKMEAKLEKEMLKKYQQQLKDDKDREKEEKRKRREENQRRREENERKGEIVQVIRNTAKMKRMKKKQLRNIEKRDTLGVLQKTPYAVKKANP